VVFYNQGIEFYFGILGIFILSYNILKVNEKEAKGKGGQIPASFSCFVYWRIQRISK
jgi:hypothetical protein